MLDSALRARLALATVIGVLALGVAQPAAAAEPAPFGHACSVQNGVRFCPTSTLEQRVPTFDGVPLDVDVTLPPTGKGPFPTIVMLHGWGGSKTSFEASTPAGDGNETFDYNNIYYAQHGYAVVNYSARGWGNSCGTAESRSASGCAEGWIRLADQRYEARDTQYLLGLLVDGHISKPGALGVTGISYGGGQSIELAMLKNRVRLPDGKLEPWRSPSGKALSIKAAYPRWPWSDLADALDPNGHYLDNEIAPFAQSYKPFGVEIQSYVSGLFALGQASGFVAPPGADPEADLSRWFAVTNAGEPYTAEAEEVAQQIYTYHQGYGLPPAGAPAPMLLQSGWTDDLFPPEQSLREYRYALAHRGKVALQLGDLGHSPGTNKVNTDQAFNEQAAGFFAALLRREGTPPATGSVTAYTQTCPSSAPGGGPYTAASWDQLHPSTLKLKGSPSQSFTSAGGNPTVAAELDPIGGTTEACKTVAAEAEPNTAEYTWESPGFTLMGLPTVRSTVRLTGPFGEVAVRLWDVMPDGQQRLVSRGIYRVNEGEAGIVSFQLHGNGYEFPAGDKVKLQFLGRDAPYYRAANGPFSIELTEPSISLPTL
jgi:hypothetical protein